MALKVNRGALIAWMKGENEVLTDEMQIRLERCLETEGEECLLHVRSIFSGLQEGFPCHLWTLDGETFMKSPPDMQYEECNWCLDLPMEEAHLCPKCWGTGVFKNRGMIKIEVAYHFLFHPLRTRDNNYSRIIE